MSRWKVYRLHVLFPLLNKCGQRLPYVMLGELYLNSFGISSSLLLLAEQLLGVAHPGQQLVQCVLELA